MKRVVGRVALAVVGLGWVVSAAVAAPDELDELLSLTLANRLARAESLRVGLVDRLRGDYDALAPLARDKLALLEERTLTPGLPVEDLALTGALLHALAADLDPADTLSRGELSAAAAAVSQECLRLLRAHANPWGLSADSLGALAERRPDPGAGPGPLLWAATPPPYAARPSRVLLERGERREIAPGAGAIDWFGPIAGSDRVLVRAGGRLLEAGLDSTTTDLGEAGGPGAPPPVQNAAAEYVAAVDGAGALRVLRRGVAAEPWRAIRGVRPRATAFSPAALALAAADSAGAILRVDLETGAIDTLAATGEAIAGLVWSPRGESVAWEVEDAEGTRRRAGVVAVVPGGPTPRLPGDLDLRVEGAVSWAPDGVSWFVPGRRDEEAGLWRIDGRGAARIGEFAPAREADLTIALDFRSVAVTTAPDPHPGPWGWTVESPFAWRARPWTVLELRWPDGAARPLLDRPGETSAAATFDYRARWLVRDVVFDAGGDPSGAARAVRRALFALDLDDGDDVPLTHDGVEATRPTLMAGETWLLFLVPAAPDERAGRLFARSILLAQPNPREAERMHLRALPYLRKGEPAEALSWLRDSLRLDPDGVETRRVLAATLIEEAAAARDGAEAGMLLAGGVRELGHLYALNPMHPRYGDDLARGWAALSALAGRAYAAEAARRARAFLDADPDADASPERVRTVLWPTLLDAALWDPFRPEPRDLLAAGLRVYRERATGR